jgi:hypothetical protein
MSLISTTAIVPVFEKFGTRTTADDAFFSKN